ncbi:outer membrane usher protein [Chimaeribacter californicus]|uniref:Outer membrane usher protein n=1 Tax=Chimaeribacter californicus TaxID=2060067 RepID=A0A2N5EA80_9GAMM|nr:outer membrane usher protein [Chimaeribacter californicus]
MGVTVSAKKFSRLFSAGVWVVCLVSVRNSQAAADVEFNEQFLYNTGSPVELSRFARGNPVLPGTYPVTLQLNNVPKMTGDVTFLENGTPVATPCLTLRQLMQLGIQTDDLLPALEAENSAEPLEQRCLDLTRYYSTAQLIYDPSAQVLDVSLPQIYVLQQPAGYIDPALWDYGIPAAMLSYDLNAYQSVNENDRSESAYAGLRFGGNLGAWRFRARGNLDWDSDSGTDYDSHDIYLQRDIPSLKAQFLVGDAYTRGDTFGAVSLRGIRLYNDDRMQPRGLSSFTPVVRGVARTNAKVTVMQDGNKVYETTVPPGAFEITDLSTASYGQDLDVTVEEADGSKNSFSIPCASVTQMLRPGASRWDIGLGQYNGDDLSARPWVMIANGYYGFNNTFTGYAGVEYLDIGYASGLLGVAMNTRFGAIAFDVTHSYLRDPEVADETLQGQSYRLSYNKTLSSTDTSFNFAAYRFSTEHYMTLSDAASLHGDTEVNGDYNQYQRMKNQIQLNISQPVRINDTDYGSLYLTGSWEDYWGVKDEPTSQFSAGYSNSFRWGSYSISVQRTYDELGVKDDSVYLNLTLPLENFSPSGKAPGGFSTLNAGMTLNRDGSSNASLSANGNSEDNRFNYSVSTSYNRTDEQSLADISGYGTYNSAYGPLSASASVSDEADRQYSLSYSGGMVLHGDGLTLAPAGINDNETLALVHASGAEGAGVASMGRINSDGYAVNTGLSAYRENTIALDIGTLTRDVEIKNTSTLAIPAGGAVVKVNFETNDERSVLLALTRTDRGFIPLAADVLLNGRSVGVVGQAGQAFVRGIPDSGVLQVAWGSGADQRCRVNYQLSAATPVVAGSLSLGEQPCVMETKSAREAGHTATAK